MELFFQNITKSYKSKIALNNFDLTIKEGIHALLGPNGAGKSTLMNILAGLLKPTSGRVLLAGRDTVEMDGTFREILGYLPQDTGFYPNFSGYELINYFSMLKDVKAPQKRIKELLEFVNLTDDAKRKYKEYSGGMKRRLGIAVSMLNDPKILILDEPTSGLDPKERMRFRNILSKIGKDKIIILATHIVSDVENIADTVIMLKSGEIALYGTKSQVIQSVDGKVWLAPSIQQEAEEYLLSHSNASIIKNDKDVSLRIVSEEKPFENAVNCPPSLEDVYNI